jgi:endonuclease-3
MMVATPAAKRHASRVVAGLRKNYPEAECALNFSTPLELLVATILSAQCTDKRVNLVTPALFARYRSAADFAAAPREAIEKAIQTAGFFRSKAKSIQMCCARLAADYAGQVPRDLEALVELPGVGRKTANVVLGTAYQIASGVVVDTHVTRLSRRLGLTKQSDAVKIERDLMTLLPQREWVGFSHRMIHHGRAVCVARRPRCEICQLAKICPRIGVEASGGRATTGKKKTPAGAKGSKPRRGRARTPAKV